MNTPRRRPTLSGILAAIVGMCVVLVLTWVVLTAQQLAATGRERTDTLNHLVSQYADLYQQAVDAGLEPDTPNPSSVATPVPGPSGAAGRQGDMGEPGRTGPQGPAGEPGPAGPASTVPGPQGATGTAGATGSSGADGAQGPQGEQGPQGPQGEPGPQGPAGEPGGAVVCPEGSTLTQMYVQTRTDAMDLLTQAWTFTALCVVD